MTCEQCSEWLGDAVDGTLDVERHAQVDAHCRTCSSCRELLDDLTEIRAAAATLVRHAPSPDVWKAIAAKVGQPVKVASIWPQIAAAAALVVVLGTAAWFAIGTAPPEGGNGTASELVRSAASELQLAEQHYLNAITALEQLTVGRDTALDPAVASEIAQSLKSIDRAIDDSRTALKSEPNSFVAQTSLLEALRMKVALLQETVSLMNARS
jgi:Putative zinc-finger